MLSKDLDVDAIALHLAFRLELLEGRVDVLGEAEFTGDEHLLSARELELGSTESLLGVLDILRPGSDGDED